MFYFFLIGQNLEVILLFIYDGKMMGDNDNWGSYVDVDYQLVFFNFNLIVMFIDDFKRIMVISICNNGVIMDDNFILWWECYFDFKVIDNVDLVLVILDIKVVLDEIKLMFGNYLLFCFYLISILFFYNCEKFRYFNQNEIFGGGGC